MNLFIIRNLHIPLKFIDFLADFDIEISTLKGMVFFGTQILLALLILKT